MIRSLRYKILILLLTSLVISCTESYDIENRDFESLLIVEATITNELKTQEVKLSKTFPLDSDETNEVSNAQVLVETLEGTVYNFKQSKPGLYTSEIPFRAKTNNAYTLKIKLPDGKSYRSTPEILPTTSQIESLNVELVTLNGEQGIQISVNSNQNANGAIYFRYDYEETYKIIVPEPTNAVLKLKDVDFTDGLSYDLERVPRSQDVSTCYSTKKNKNILLSSLTDSQNSYVEDFPIRFIKSDNSIIRDRYSILVSQYVQSFESYNFYKILKKLGSTENLFSENQPGFIRGNIVSNTNEEENVVGFFEVSSVSSKRIYFNYKDFNIPKPKYFYECNYVDNLNFNDRAKIPGMTNEYTQIYNLLVGGKMAFYIDENPIYSFVDIKCTDCTSYSSNLKPEFWEE